MLLIIIFLYIYVCIDVHGTGQCWVFSSIVLYLISSDKGLFSLNLEGKDLPRLAGQWAPRILISLSPYPQSSGYQYAQCLGFFLGGGILIQTLRKSEHFKSSTRSLCICSNFFLHYSVWLSYQLWIFPVAFSLIKNGYLWYKISC